MTHASEKLARTSRIVAFLVRYRRAGVFGGPDLDDRDAAVAGGPDSRPVRFVDDLEALGPTFIKAGQALSTRPDLVPTEYLDALARMQDDVTPVPFAQVRATVEDALGVRLGKVFATFDELPLGSASLAQVHRATLRDGREVAVKVQRPGVASQVHADLEILATLAARADRLTRIGRRMRFVDWVHEFRKTLLAELDYSVEAENLARFADHLEDYPHLVVPRPVWNLTRPRVLVMDLVHGARVTGLSGLRRTEQSLRPLAVALVRGYLDQMFVHGEIHADPHPGNMRVTDDGRLAIFDLGMIAHIPPRQRTRLLKLMFSAVDGRGEQVAAETVALGTRLEEFNEELFQREIGQLVARYAARPESRATAGNQHLSEGQLMLALTRISSACGLRLPPELGLLGKTLLGLEGVCRILAPDLRVGEVVEDHLQHMMTARLRRSMSLPALAGEAIELQELLQDAPRKLSSLLSLVADNRLQVRVTGLQESRLMENLQKIANRIASGVIMAALILASAQLMESDARPQVFGYPVLALVLFLIAAGLGLAIVVSALLNDRRAKPHEERGPDA